MKSIIKFIITDRLPGMNEYIKALNSNRFKGNLFKKRAEAFIWDCFYEQHKCIKIEKMVEITYIWVEPNRKRDKDNIAAGKKWINDALVKNGVLSNDGWKQIKSFSDHFKVDKYNPRVEVEIKEVKE